MVDDLRRQPGPDDRELPARCWAPTRVAEHARGVPQHAVRSRCRPRSSRWSWRRSRPTRSPGSSSRSATRCSWRSSRCCWCPIQMVLIPLSALFRDLGLIGTFLADLDHAHHVRAAVRDLPAAELLHHAAEGPHRGGAHRRRHERSGSSARSSSRSRCRRWRATRSSSSCGSGTTSSSRSSSRRARQACR